MEKRFGWGGEFELELSPLYSHARLRLLFVSVSIMLGAVSCGEFPKDPESTVERVRREHSYRVGLVAPAARMRTDLAVTRMLQRLDASTGASPKVIEGEAEELLTRLEGGDLDLVVGHFEKGSPWGTRVTFGPELRLPSNGVVGSLVPVMRNGENAWIKLVERHARDVAVPAK